MGKELDDKNAIAEIRDQIEVLLKQGDTDAADELTDLKKEIEKPSTQIEEKLSIEEQETDVQGKVDRSKKLAQEMKDKISPLVTKGSKYNNGRVFDLKGFSDKGSSLGADKDGFFCYTHRARSKSHETPDKIPQKDINFIKSTG